ncbi:MAG TPA: VWA domain-containing protein [Blastocatellia bacterium]|nr:VWA domain-containing protein [Blastocatellia bacterium]
MNCRWIWLLIMTCGLALTPTRAQEQDPPKTAPAEEEVLSIETNLVVLNVTITDARQRYVAGLKVEDFKILENNTPQRVLTLGLEETSFATAILLDTSGSMENKMTLERAACANFVDGIRTGDLFAIYSFGGTKVRELQEFTEIRDIPDSVWDLRAEGQTPLYDALVTASEALAKRPERRRAILIVSDGADTQSRASLDQALRKALAAHIAVYAVDMSDASVYGTPLRDTGAEVLKSVSAKTGGRFFRTPGGSKLREAFASIVDELRNQYTLTYESSNERMDGRWRTVEVRVARPQLTVRSRQGYFARKKS